MLFQKYKQIFSSTQHSSVYSIAMLVLFICLGAYFYLREDKCTIKCGIKTNLYLIVFAASFGHAINIVLSFFEFSQKTTSITLTIPNIICIALLAPVAEELFFRGILYLKLKIYTNVFAAMLVSSIFFSFLHSGLQNMIFAFVIGFLFCYVFEKTGNIISTILVHFAINTTSVFLEFFGIWYSSQAEKAICLVIFLFISVIMTILINREMCSKHREKFLKMNIKI